jgi:UDP-N-acetyl-D-galactosamine dehydrogenase
MIQSGLPVNGGVVTVLGLTFKEDVPDLRNTRVMDIITELKDYGVKVQVCDPCAHPEEAEAEYGIRLLSQEALAPAHAVILAVPHRQYLEAGWPGVVAHLAGQRGVVVDVKARLERAARPDGIILWRL